MEAMQAYPQVLFVQGQGLSVLHYMCIGADAAARARAQRAAGAGMIEAAVAAIRVQAQELAGMAAPVQQLGVMALTAVCDGDDAAGRARKQQAAGAGALEAVVEAMRANPQAAEVQIFGCRSLLSVCGGGASAAARARRQRAAQAGGRRSSSPPRRRTRPTLLCRAQGSWCSTHFPLKRGPLRLRPPL